MPVVITGSGPSLEAVLPQIAGARDNIFLLAASSSVPALAAGGIVPDMVISTDGGGWALLHLQAFVRMKSACVHRPVNLALALCAAVPSQCSESPILAINDGSLWQTMLLSAAGIPSVFIPQRGTVTASALDLALLLSSGNIFLAGMDFSVSDIKSHARPYGFDHLFYGSASRFAPVYSQYFIRSNEMKAGGSYAVYAAWFKSRLASWEKRIFSLGANHAVLAGNLPHRSLHNDTAYRGTNACHFKEITEKIPGPQRRRKAAETLITALNNGQYTAALTGELGPLLFPSETTVTPDEIARYLEPFTKGIDNG
jgi:hypothetical protein